jgi:hypothetical protein
MDVQRARAASSFVLMGSEDVQAGQGGNGTERGTTRQHWGRKDEPAIDGCFKSTVARQRRHPKTDDVS